MKTAFLLLLPLCSFLFAKGQSASRTRSERMSTAAGVLSDKSKDTSLVVEKSSANPTQWFAEHPIRRDCVTVVHSGLFRKYLKDKDEFIYAHRQPPSSVRAVGIAGDSQARGIEAHSDGLKNLIIRGRERETPSYKLLEANLIQQRVRAHVLQAQNESLLNVIHPARPKSTGGIASTDTEKSMDTVKIISGIILGGLGLLGALLVYLLTRTVAFIGELGQVKESISKVGNDVALHRQETAYEFKDLKAEVKRNGEKLDEITKLIAGTKDTRRK